MAARPGAEAVKQSSLPDVMHAMNSCQIEVECSAKSTGMARTRSDGLS